MWPDEAIYLPWGVWLLSWFVAAFWANRTVNAPGFAQQVRYRVFEIGGFFLLLFYAGRPGPNGVPATRFMPLWTLPMDARWAMVALAAAGFAFCWWARIHLGRLWSGTVTRKEDHHVVDTGPYAIVRHPIYTGILIAALATVLERGTVPTLAGFALLIVAFVMKGRVEENFLRAELGAEAYDAYARKTAMLVPFVKL